MTASEDRVLVYIVARGIPEPEREFRIGPFRVDFAWPLQRVVVEVDGHPTHRTIEGRRRDRARDRLLAGWGWNVIRVNPDDVDGLWHLDRRWNDAATLCRHDWADVVRADRRRRAEERAAAR